MIRNILIAVGELVALTLFIGTLILGTAFFSGVL